MRMFPFVVLMVLYIIGGTHASDYASTAAQFDPTGRILKTEYAKRAVTERGGPVCAIRCADGILLATARRSRRNRLVLSAPPKVHFVDKHICIGVSGSLSQATALMKASRSLCARYKEIYDSPMPVEKLCDSLSDELHRLTRDGQSNPFGVGLVIAGWDDELGPQVYTTDPEGSFAAWNAVAIGADAPKVMAELASLIDAHNAVDSSGSSTTTGSNDANKGKGNYKSRGRRNGITVESMWPKFRSAILGKFFRNEQDHADGTPDTARSTSSDVEVRAARVRADAAVQDEDGVMGAVEVNAADGVSGTGASGGEVGRRDDRVGVQVEADEMGSEEAVWSVEIYTCMKASTGEICWSRVDQQQLQ